MITKTLARFASRTEDAPDATMHMLHLSMLDWVSCGIAGASEPVARITREMVLDEGGAPQAQLFGGGEAPARAAALVNGATSHALDYDDTHFAHIGHPSVAVFPAALAVAQSVGAGERDFRFAALLGIEASIRVGVWLGRDHYQTGFHQTGTAGAFGAAAAAARLLKLNENDMAATLGLVATRASGLKSQFGTMGKPYNAGIAAANGVEAALLVARGFQPEPLALEIAQGFGPTHAGQAQNAALEGIGQKWLFDEISHKFHACCHGLHATLEAMASVPLPPADQVAGIRIATHPRWMSVCNQPSPETGLGAKFSYRMVAAMALAGHDTAALDSYSDGLCAGPALQALRSLVVVSADPALSEMQARVEIETKAGDTITAAHDLAAPIPPDVRQQRLVGKAGALLGADRADRLWQLIESGAAPEALGRFISE